MTKKFVVTDDEGQSVPYVVMSQRQLTRILLTPVACLIGLLLIAGIVGFIIFSSEKENRRERIQASIGFVELLNSRQAQQNIIAAGLYIDYSERAIANKKLLREDKSAPRAVQESRRESVRRNSRLASELAWSPLIDARRAIRDRSRYKLPMTQPFTKEEALHIIDVKGRVKQR